MIYYVTTSSLSFKLYNRQNIGYFFECYGKNSNLKRFIIKICNSDSPYFKLRQLSTNYRKLYLQNWTTF